MQLLCTSQFGSIYICGCFPNWNNPFLPWLRKALFSGNNTQIDIVTNLIEATVRKSYSIILQHSIRCFYNSEIIMSANFAKLIKDVIRNKRNSTLNFFLHLPQIMEEIGDDENRVVQLMGFISDWCVFSDGFATRNLVEQFHILLPEKPTVAVAHAFMPILLKVIEEGGTYIAAQLLEFSDDFLERCPEGFIDQTVFHYMFHFLESEGLENEKATVLVFISTLSKALSEEHLRLIMKLIPCLFESPCMNLKLAVIDSVENFYEYVDDDARKMLCDEIIVKSLSSFRSLVKTHVLTPVVRTGYFGDELLAMAKKETNWKVKMAMCGFFEELVEKFPEFESVMFTLARDKIVTVRSAALTALGEAITMIDNKKEAVKVCEAAMQVQDTVILEAGSRLLRKMVKNQTSLAERFQLFIGQLERSKSVHIITQLLKGLCPYLKLGDKEKKVIDKWMRQAMKSPEWRFVDEAMKGMTKIMRNPDNREYAKTYLPEICERLEHPVLGVRKAVVKYLTKYVKVFGWEIFPEVIAPKVQSILGSGRVRLAITSAMLLRRLLSLKPPEDIAKMMKEMLDQGTGRRLAKGFKELPFL